MQLTGLTRQIFDYVNINYSCLTTEPHLPVVETEAETPNT